MMKVPAVGPKPAKIMIVGESPGKTEVREGKPFVGPAGKKLDEFLHAAGLDRKDIFITNVVKVLPEFTKDKDEFFFTTVLGKRKSVISREPTLPYLEGIVELHKEIQEVDPFVIVPLGNYALWALTQEWGIMNWRGSIMESKLVKGKKVIPTIHPAWYLYGEEGKAQRHKQLLGNWDFLRIAEQSRFREIIRPERNFNVRPTPSDIEAAIERFTDPSLEYLGVDTEWYNPDTLAYIAFGVGTKDIICIPPDSMLAFRAYKAILGSPVPKVWQNAMFDATALYRMGIEVRNVAHDTMVEWFFNWGSTIEENGLDVICSVLTEQPYYKSDVEFVGQDDDRGREYCCTDVAVMNEAHEKMQKEEFEITGTRKGYEISISILNTMIRAGQTGILIDQDKLLKIRAENEKKADELERSVTERVGQSFNARSWQQVQRIVYDELGFGKRFTARSTSQDVLMDIAATLYAENPNDPKVQILIDIIKIRQYRNQNSRYDHLGIVDRDGRAKTNWKLNGTKNGRLSATKPWWNGVPLQTVPESSREYYIADPGHCFIGWDLGQAEARVVAIKTRDYELLEDMARGVDIHLKMAAALPFGKTYEEHYAAMKAVQAQGKSKDQYKERFLAKTTRHASNYIQSAYGLQKQINKKFLETMIGVNASMAKLLAEGFLAASPGLETWWKWVLDTVNERRWLENCFGRRRNWYHRIYPKDHDHKDAVAFEPQSTVADLTTISIVEVDRAAEWVTPLIHMHDGGLIQVPLSMKDDALELVKKTMTKEILIDGEPLTIPVDLKWGFDWKNMEAV